MAMITEALLRFQEAGEPLKIGQEVWNALSKAGQWLSRHHDRVVLNHTAGAVAALGNLYALTGAPAWREGAQAALDVLARSQNKEGWFPEYGGADPGYTSVSINFLAQYWRRSQDLRAWQLLKRAVAFLEPFVHPDGTVGGTYGSRNTRYLLPHGLFILRHLPQARQALARWADAQQAGRGITLQGLDDRYRGFFLANQLLVLLDLDAGATLDTDAASPTAKPEEMFYSEAGLVKAERGTYLLYCSLRKLGVFDCFAERELIYADSGYDLRFADGRRATTQWPDPQAVVSWDASQGQADVAGRLALLQSPELFHRTLLPHRLLSHALGAIGSGGEAINRRIKALFVKPRRTAPAVFRRCLRITDQGLDIRDDLAWDAVVSDVVINRGWGRMHVPSSNFYADRRDGQEYLDVSGKHSLSIVTTLDSRGLRRSIV
ncbi:hypothetical protein [Solidesulfovibrio sp. C21]|uniref:hypothetical protein n=1 Tax=Solidesulfovibrio sp. C21 TaxID=3398613 RepID=UPI0039FC4B2B